MENQTSPTPLPPISFDPSTFTSFGPPPPTPDETTKERINNLSASRLVDTVFSNISSAFRRRNNSNVSASSSSSRMPSSPSIVIAATRDRKISETGSSPSSAVLGSSPSEKLFIRTREQRSSSYKQQLSSLFRKDPPAIMGLNVIWASDETCFHCYECSVRFTTFNRRHHCRFCGRIFCDSCTRFRIPGQPFGVDDGLRTCEVCYRQTLRTLLENHATSISEDVLERLTELYTAIQTPDQSPGGSLLGSGNAQYSPRSQSISEPNNNVSPSTEWKEPLSPRPRKKTPPAPILLLPANDQKPGQTAAIDVTKSLAVVKMSEIGTPPQTPLSLRAMSFSASPSPSNRSFSAVPPVPDKGKTVSQLLTSEIDQAITESLKQSFSIDERQGAMLAGIYRSADVETSLRRLYKQHLSRLCSHLLTVDQLDVDKWQRFLLQIVFQVLRIVKPQPHVYPDALDIRQCVKIKKVFDPSVTAHFEFVDGLVFTKSLSHRLMARSLHKPRILLIESGLEFEREQEQLTTLDVVVNQAAEQMLLHVSQIASVQPTLLLCGGSIPPLANHHLVENGIAAAANVKPRTLELITRYTGAAVLPSVDSLSLSSGGQSLVRLGTCQTFASFSVHMHSRFQKTFICLSGCEPIGCTILIHDKAYSDLVKIKKILRQLLLVGYGNLIMARYLVAYRADPFSLSLEVRTSASTDNKDEDEDLINETQRKTIISSRRSFSGTRDTVMFGILQRVRHRRKLSIMTTFSTQDFSLPVISLPGGSRRQSTNNFDEAFALANSGLLALSPLLRLPDPSKKSALFDASPSRIFYESPLFSSFSASFVKAMTPTVDGTELMPPLTAFNCVEKPLHSFFTTPLIHGLSNDKMQALMIDFRCNGSLFDIVDPPVASFSGSTSRQDSSKPNEDDQKVNWVKPLSISECLYLHVLVSMFSPDSHLSSYNFCYGPCLESWPFYQSPDHSLGAFLNEHCFVPFAICQHAGCGAPKIDHIRRFASNTGRVDIIVRPLALPVDQANSQNILTWAMCRHCRTVTPFTNADEIAFSMSFAHFLHRKFDAVDHVCLPLVTGSAKCQHAFEKHYLQFFAKDRLVAVVKHSRIDVFDIVIPRLKVDMSSAAFSTISLQQKLLSLTPDAGLLIKAANSHFDATANYVESLRSNIQILLGASPGKMIAERFVVLEALVATERKKFIEQISQVEEALASGDKIVDDMALGLFGNIYLSWLDWNERLKTFVHHIRSEAVMPQSNPLPPEPTPHESTTSQRQRRPTPSGGGSNSSPPVSLQDFTGNAADLIMQGMSVSKEFLPSNTSEVFVVVESNPILQLKLEQQQRASVTQPNKTFGRSLLDLLTESDLLSHPLFRSKLKLPMEVPFPVSHHYIFNDAKSMHSIAVFDEEPSSLIAFVLSSETYLTQLSALAVMDATLTNYVNEADVGESRKSTLKATITLGESSSVSFGVLNEADETESLSSNANDQSDETSQLSIAGGLLDEFTVLNTTSTSDNSQISTPAPSSPKLHSKLEDANLSIPSPPRSVSSKKNEPSRKNDKRHVTIEWSDAAIDKDVCTKFSVTAYHAVVFDEVRQILIGSNENGIDAFVQSLMRCKAWQAAGGKSGVKYFKTLDGRFILKQIQKQELQTIFDMAPDYLDHIKSSRERKRPSALVPILGAFHVSLENGSTGRSFKFDLVVMEYLFRSAVISEKFDLKGSQRNRLVKRMQSLQPKMSSSSGADLEPAGASMTAPTEPPPHADVVLLDENLLIRSLQDPLYVYPHSKKLLLQAIAGDTHFLAGKSVMDYSLLVGIDTQAHCLVVGIIDYLRTYTWDKMVESAVKSSGLLGGQGKAPTIVAPTNYRSRFNTAMRHFFLEVPDAWLAYETHKFARRK